MTPLSAEKTREAVREHYGQVAKNQEPCGCGPGCCNAPAPSSLALGYSDDQIATLPQGADMGLGCGSPLSFAALQPGEVVLDLGSGGGIDCFLAAEQVGPSGKVIGIDMTAEMVAKARRNAAGISATNVEFRLSEIEALPVADRSVDVVVSNCVINLSPDKASVFREAFRVLRPGGRIAISDIVANAPLPERLAGESPWVGCIGGAPAIDDLRDGLLDAGFVGVTVDINESSRSFIKNWTPESGAEQFVAAAAIRAMRPIATGCCGTTPGSSCC